MGMFILFIHTYILIMYLTAFDVFAVFYVQYLYNILCSYLYVHQKRKMCRLLLLYSINIWLMLIFIITICDNMYK